MTPAPGFGAVLAIDVGSVRIGLARCTDAEGVVIPLATLANHAGVVDEVVGLIDQMPTGAVIIGLPLTLSGEVGPAAQTAQLFADSLCRRVEPVPVYLVDERLTTVEAQRRLSASGRSHRDSRRVIDQMAAAILLEHAVSVWRQTGNLPGIQVTLEQGPLPKPRKARHGKPAAVDPPSPGG